jgi:integrase
VDEDHTASIKLLTQEQKQQQEKENFNDNNNPLKPFLFALKSLESKRQYPKRLKVFFDFGLDKKLSLNEQSKIFIQKYNNNNENRQGSGEKWAAQYFMNFIEYQNDRVRTNEISPSTVPNYYKAAKLFCIMNDIVLNWQKIAKGLPERKQHADDRPPTLNEIKKIIEYPDKRVRIIVTVMVSSGIRVGAWDYMKWKHITPLKDENGNIVAAKLLVYPQDKEEYFTFVTSEAYTLLKEWMDFRESHGEKITGESWVMRDVWLTSERAFKYHHYGLAGNPKPLKSTGIKSLIERAIHSQKIREKIDPNKRNYEFKRIHGFRKFFKTRCENEGMKSINIEILMGHNIGVSGSYYKPTEKEVLVDYLKIMDQLIINDEFRLSQQVQELKEKNQDKDLLIKAKLTEKDEQIIELQRSIKFLSDTVNRTLLADPENKIVDITSKSDGMLVKGIALKPEIKNKVVGQVKINSSDKKK